MIWNESLLQQLDQKGWVYFDPGLDQVTLQAWRKLLLDKAQHGQFRPAQIAQNQNFEIRSDKICWLEPTKPEDQPVLEALHAFRKKLTQYLMISAPHLEAHFAIYPQGHFYKRHLDQPEKKSIRVLSFVIYLHDSWEPGDGGELAITQGDSDQVLEVIEPKSGRVVIFKSDEVWHEVRKSNFERLSLTGWFRRGL